MVKRNKHKYEIVHHTHFCDRCTGTGFIDRVDRGALTMNPRNLLCTKCKGRGWKVPSNDPWQVWVISLVTVLAILAVGIIFKINS